MKDLDKELKKTEELRKHNYAKGLSRLKVYYGLWAMEQFKQNNIPDFKLAYMPFIFNIELDGITNTELAKRTKVTKQAMGQVVKELERKKYIKITANPADKRSSIIHLTEKGKEFILTAYGCMKKFHADLQKRIGKKKFNDFVDTVFEIIAYHEELEIKK